MMPIWTFANIDLEQWWQKSMHGCLQKDGKPVRFFSPKLGCFLVLKKLVGAVEALILFPGQWIGNPLNHW